MRAQRADEGGCPTLWNRALGIRRRAAAAALCLGLGLAPGIAPAAPPAQTEAEEAARILKEECVKSDAKSLLADRLAELDWETPARTEDEELAQHVDRALQPANNPDRAAAVMSEIIGDPRVDAERLALVRYLALRDFADYELLSCEAIRSYLSTLLAYRELHAKASANDPTRDYYARSIEAFRIKLAVALQARRRLSEKEAAVIKVLSLAGG